MQQHIIGQRFILKQIMLYDWMVMCMKYYYKIASDNVISFLGTFKKVPKQCTEITKEQYSNYISILNSIVDREGFTKVVKLFIDGTCKVEYIQEHAVHEIVEEAG